MLVAALDTATQTLSCALLELDAAGATVLARATEEAGTRPPPAARSDGSASPAGAHGDGSASPARGHGARLPSVLVELLASVERRLPDLQGYAVGLGPGSFTGLRIGLATWKGLAYANRRPIAGASSLMAMALAAAGEAGEGALLVPLLDAKKGEVYAGFYQRIGPARVAPLLPDAALPPDGLLTALAGLPRDLEPLAFGEGWVAHQATLGGRLTQLATHVRTPTAEAVGRLAAAALRAAPYDVQALSALEPHYVRASEAEVKFPDGLPPVRLAGPG
jgi:tRNA threonylcarbamoyladenosine biosynthesis protein TsaB